MIEKRYYRMKELERNFGFSLFDYQYLCESLNNPLHIFSYAHFFILAERVPRSFDKIIRGVAYYNGIIELTQSDRRSLLRDGSVSINTAYLSDAAGIKMMESCSRVLLNSLLNNSYSIDYASSISDIDLSQCDALLIDENNRELVHSRNTPLPESLNINFEDLVLKKELVDWCKLQLGLDTATNQSREHLMKEQIKQVCRDNPHLGATKLYKLIRENFENDIDATDPLSILISIDRNEIIWGKPGVREHTMSLKTFQNTVSEIKKSR